MSAARQDLLKVWASPVDFARDAMVRGRSLDDWTFVLLGYAALLVLTSVGSILSGEAAAIDTALGGPPTPARDQIILSLIAIIVLTIAGYAQWRFMPMAVRWFGGQGDERSAALAVYAWFALGIAMCLAEFPMQALGALLFGTGYARVGFYLGELLLLLAISLYATATILRVLFRLPTFGSAMAFTLLLAAVAMTVLAAVVLLVSLLLTSLDLSILSDLPAQQ